MTKTRRDEGLGFMARVAESALEGQRLDEASDADVRRSRRERGCCEAHGILIHDGAFDAVCPQCEADIDAAEQEARLYRCGLVGVYELCTHCGVNGTPLSAETVAAYIERGHAAFKE